MKAVGVVAIVVGLGLMAWLVAFASAQNPAPAAAPPHVTIAITAASVRESSSTRVDTLLLWNRNERSLPIGHGLKSCVKAGPGDLFGTTLMNCVLNLVLPLGKVSASGIVHNVNRYTLTITGGTGIYRGVTGPLFVRRVATNGVRRLTFAVG